MDKNKHTTGTEIKAITYSAMQIIDKPEKAVRLNRCGCYSYIVQEVYVIVDI